MPGYDGGPDIGIAIFVADNSATIARRAVAASVTVTRLRGDDICGPITDVAIA
jgi:hypothetical protein